MVHSGNVNWHNCIRTFRRLSHLKIDHGNDGARLTQDGAPRHLLHSGGKLTQSSPFYRSPQNVLPVMFWDCDRERPWNQFGKHLVVAQASVTTDMELINCRDLLLRHTIQSSDNRGYVLLSRFPLLVHIESYRCCHQDLA